MISLFVMIVIFSITGTLHAEQELLDLKPEVAGPIFAAISKCAERTHFSLEALQQVKNREYTEIENYKKLLFCIYREGGYAYPNGRLNVEKAALLFPAEHNIKPLLEKCDKDDKDPVETVFNFQKCFLKVSPVALAV